MPVHSFFPTVRGRGQVMCPELCAQTGGASLLPEKLVGEEGGSLPALPLSPTSFKWKITQNGKYAGKHAKCGKPSGLQTGLVFESRVCGWVCSSWSSGGCGGHTRGFVARAEEGRRAHSRGRDGPGGADSEVHPPDVKPLCLHGHGGRAPASETLVHAHTMHTTSHRNAFKAHGGTESRAALRLPF